MRLEAGFQVYLYTLTNVVSSVRYHYRKPLHSAAHYFYYGTFYTNS